MLVRLFLVFVVVEANTNSWSNTGGRPRSVRLPAPSLPDVRQPPDAQPVGSEARVVQLDPLVASRPSGVCRASSGSAGGTILASGIALLRGSMQRHVSGCPRGEVAARQPRRRRGLLQQVDNGVEHPLLHCGAATNQCSIHQPNT